MNCRRRALCESGKIGVFVVEIVKCQNVLFCSGRDPLKRFDSNENFRGWFDFRSRPSVEDFVGNCRENL